MITKTPATQHKAKLDTLRLKHGDGQAYRRSGASSSVMRGADLLHRGMDCQRLCVMNVLYGSQAIIAVYLCASSVCTCVNTG
jgi:hypothetical protein